MNESDRRKMERFDLKLPARITWMEKGRAPKSIDLVTSNICSGGSYLMTGEPLPWGTVVKMNFILDLGSHFISGGRKSHIDVSGFVTRTDQQGMAICFNRNYKITPH